MIRTTIGFLAGFDPACDVPEQVRSAGLRHRFAVIQDSYRPDSVDMYFDEALWYRLLEFANQFGSGFQIGIVDHDDAERATARNSSGKSVFTIFGRVRAPQVPKQVDEMSVETFLAEWRALNKEDRYPPCITVRDGGNLVLCIAPEYWTRVGGPMPYHDSYTYSIFSNEDLAARVMQFLADAEASPGWELSTTLLHPNPAPKWKLF